MTSRIRILVWCALFSALTMLAGRVQAEVLLNEVLADPARDWDGDGALQSRDDEWVEIVNTGPGPVDLNGYRLAGEDGSWRYAFAGTLAPGAVTVVYGSESYAWEQDTGNPAFGLRLTNSGSSIALWFVGAPDSVMVDCYTYADHEADDDRSSGRVPDGGDTWALFDALFPYEGAEEPPGSGCTPTPGAAVSCPTPVERGTWGSIKALLAWPGRR